VRVKYGLSSAGLETRDDCAGQARGNPPESLKDPHPYGQGDGCGRSMNAERCADRPDRFQVFRNCIFCLTRKSSSGLERISTSEPAECSECSFQCDSHPGFDED
jgi:hypothetical protein